MAILQAIAALIGRSAGRLLNTIFGWAVRALFGAAGAQTSLSLLVMAAALWPLLLLGTVAPKVAAFALAFVPIPDSVPEWPIRIGWIVLAVLVPAIVGLTLAAKAPPGSPRESFATRVLRGYPITLGVALAFLISFIGVPLQRLAAMARGRKDVLVPLITDNDGYFRVAAHLKGVLNRRGFELVESEPGFVMRAPSQVLRKLAGKALRNYVPDRTVYLRGPELELALYPNSCLLRGTPAATVVAQGLALEALTPCPAFQTTTPAAQQIERQIKRVWQVFAENREAHAGSALLLSRVDDISRELIAAKVEYEEWETLYRQLLQLARALRGEPQLMAQIAEPSEDEMEHTARAEAASVHAHLPPRDLSTMDLMGEIASKTALLVRKEVDLARTELKADLQSELSMVKRLAIAGVAGMAALNLLLVAAVFALAPYLDARFGALLLAGALVLITLIAGVTGWKQHVGQPLARTRKTLKEDVQWAKEELA
ncbi:MAG TPA: phage holin family protein [Terriglobales bacterium]|nr:phage holin family protein [Terriglobales bacterium]